MNLTILTCMHLRYDVSRLFCIGLHRFIMQAPIPINIRVVAAVTDQTSADICKEFDFDFVITENKPIGRKWNVALHKAMVCEEYQQPAYVMIMGDDDLIASEIWPQAWAHMQKQTPYFGIQGCMYLDTATGAACSFTYTQPNKVMGAARWISAEIIKRTSFMVNSRFTVDSRVGDIYYQMGQSYWIPNHIHQYLHSLGKVIACKGEAKIEHWDNHLLKGLDNCSECNIAFRTGELAQIITPPDGKFYLMDCKSSQNIWAYRKISQQPGAKPFDPEQALWFLSDAEKEYIHKTFQNNPTQHV
jgi:hypothetical protein